MAGNNSRETVNQCNIIEDRSCIIVMKSTLVLLVFPQINKAVQFLFMTLRNDIGQQVYFIQHWRNWAAGNINITVHIIWSTALTWFFSKNNYGQYCHLLRDSKCWIYQECQICCIMGQPHPWSPLSFTNYIFMSIYFLLYRSLAGQIPAFRTQLPWRISEGWPLWPRFFTKNIDVANLPSPVSRTSPTPNAIHPCLR